jgi:hypothetical protein
MKKQTNRMLVMFIIAGFVLLGIGCTTDTSQNNQNISNQNTSNEKASDNAESSSELESKRCKENVDDKVIQSIIDGLTPAIRSQFRNNINYNWDSEEQVLTFSGYIEGKGSLYKLLESFRNYEGGNCIKVISLVGKNTGENFVWKVSPSSGDVTPCRESDVIDAITKGDVKDQIGKNLIYNYDKDARTLTFENYIYGKGKFRGLMSGLNKYEGKNCIKEIIFEKGTQNSDQTVLAAGFVWRVCEGGQCECAGGCAPCPCLVPVDVNTNTNTSSNTNSNENTNSSNSNSP